MTLKQRTNPKNMARTESLKGRAMDCCMNCRQQTAEKLTAVALGIAVANAETRLEGDPERLRRARQAALDGDWKEADRQTSTRMNLEMQHSRSRNPDAARAAQLAADANFATFNLSMAEDCGTRSFIPTESDPTYTAEAHLWNCIVMAISAASTAISHDEEAMEMAEEATAQTCEHQEAKEWVRQETQRIREERATA